MKNKFFLSFLLLLLSISLFALEWPTDKPQFKKLFGQTVSETLIENGIIFDKAQTVRAAEHGKRLITIEKKNRLKNFPSTLGNAIILTHEDGLQTVYANLGSDTITENKQVTESGSIIGKTGHSAWGDKETLLFQVIDTKRKVFINPLLLLPAISDFIKPQIKTVILIDSRNQVFPLEKTKSIRQGRYMLYASVTDKTDENSEVLAPFRVSLFINGRNADTIPFEILTAKNGSIYLGDMKFNENILYKDKTQIYLGEIDLARGKVELTILARDITGNEKKETFLLQVD